VNLTAEQARNLEQIASSNGAGPTESVLLPLTDLETSQLFAHEHGARLRHVRAQRMWLNYDGTIWRRDATGEAQRAAKQTAYGLLARAAALADSEQAKAAAKWALQVRAEPRIRAMLALAETELPIAISPEQLDTDPWLLACPNGTLELGCGELRDHEPDDLISLATEVIYDRDATCPRWERFLQEIFNGDEELIGFVHRLIGYCLTGDTREHVLVVLHGGGRNGKSTLIKILQRLLGDHGVTAALDTFLRARGDRGPRNDLARLHRARLVTAAESGEGRRLDEATVKELTGGDRIAARFLYQEHIEFVPMFKLAIVTNHKPRVDGGDDAIWARMRLVPFEVCFEGREDKQLSEKLEAELPGILAWAVRGCLAWQQEGLGQAAAVSRATAEYRQDEDVLGAFLDEACVLEGEIEPAKLREAYEDYCKEIGEKPLAASVLGKQLARRGITKDKRAGVYRGVSLR
jgi:putative DNA primase/helicase